MQVVEQQDVDAAIEGPCRLPHIGLNRHRRIERHEGLLEWHVDQREHGRGLEPPVLVHFEVVAGQVLDERALLVGHDRVDLDEVRLGPEGNARLLFGVWWRRLLRGQDGRAKNGGGQRDQKSKPHNSLSI